MKTWNKLKKSPLFLPILCLFLVLLINLFKDVSFFSVSIKNGVLYGRLIDVLNRGSEIAILAVGQTLVVAVSAGTDISVGSVMALAACGGCMVLTGYGNTSVTTVLYPIGIGILVGIIYGIVCGMINGAMVAKLKIQPMVATLILFTAARAVGLLLCNNQITYIRYEPYKYLGNFLPGCPIPTPILVTVVVILIAELILKKSSLELYIQSVGINSRASRICGINSDMICFICYTICGLCAGIAGMIASSRIYSADSNNIGLNYELDAILSVALGGNSLAGGKFNMAGSIIGAYTIQAITTTLLAMGVSTDQAPVFKAVIVVVIVVVQSPVFKNWRARQEKKKAAGKEAVA
ncbi:ABC transporter permease [Chordicoccus furentiruminis]|jgi:simple sugar transport system permease protein|uniref:ABC transporter permease n=1 Tax=Chordicoccus furentiruminis TaxID=2709410 RepID=UPI0023A891D9|nr:ABC transporter permease [Chordicoccus furentiruminis]